MKRRIGIVVGINRSWDGKVRRIIRRLRNKKKGRDKVMGRLKRIVGRRKSMERGKRRRVCKNDRNSFLKIGKKNMRERKDLRLKEWWRGIMNVEEKKREKKYRN